MAVKHIKTNGLGEAIENNDPTYRAKPTPYKEPQFIRDLKLNRERHFWLTKPEQRAKIEEHIEFMKNEWDKQDKRL